MSPTAWTWSSSDSCCENRTIQPATWSSVSWKPSHAAMVALIAVTPPLPRLRNTAGLSQLLTLSPSMTIASSYRLRASSSLFITCPFTAGPSERHGISLTVPSVDRQPPWSSGYFGGLANPREAC